MWTDAVARKLYVAGGVGQTGNEGFGAPWRLPNLSAYAETCAVLMFQTLNHRLFLATGDARYIAVMERGQIGRASCRERVCPSVYISVVAVSLKTINTQSKQTETTK